jgi:histone acetyltransferase (RNA polymerase elongator complex component)
LTSRAQEFPQLPENGDKVQLIILGGKGKGSHNQSSFSFFKKINKLIN